MDIAKQLIDQRIHKLMDENPELFSGLDEIRRMSRTFVLLGVSAYLQKDLVECENYVTDGGNDGGIDAIYYDVNDYEINVVLFQGKYTVDMEKNKAFGTNDVEKAVNCVKGVFDPGIALNLNEKTAAAINDIRSLIADGNIPMVTFVLLNNGMKWNADGQRVINNAFANQRQVTFEYFSHSDILDIISKSRPIEATLRMRGKAIQEDYNYKRVLIGRMSVLDIAELMKTNQDKLLEKNIRQYLGNNSINNAIKETLIGEKRQNFFFYNNGITMVCDKFAYNALQEKDWIVTVKGLQIINGGQTCKTITQTVSDDKETDYRDVDVLVRLYEVSDDESVISDITYATNSQNPVDFRDLKSNDDIQIQLEQGAKDFGYIYKRKRDANGYGANIIPSTVAAEAVLTVWRGKPQLAKYNKIGFFGAYYDEIFDDLNAAQMIIAVLIFRYCDKNRKHDSHDEEIQAFRPYSNYMLAYLVGKQLLNKNGISLQKLTHKNYEAIKNSMEEQIEGIIAELESNIKEFLKDYFSYLNKASLTEIDGRTMSGAFRRHDFLEGLENRLG